MILTIKQKVFAWRSTFHVYDEHEAIQFTVKGAILSWGRRFVVTNPQEQEVFRIQEKLFRFQPTFEFIEKDHAFCTLRKKLFHLRPTYEFEGLDLAIRGSYWLHDYQFVRGDQIVAEVNKKWMSWGDVYYVDIKDDRLVNAIIGAVIVIDCILMTQSQAQHHSH